MAIPQRKPVSNEGLLSGVTVLLVEDDLETRVLFEVVFRKQGAKILAAQDGFEAFSIIQAQPVDVIVSDLGLPGLNGYELIAKIRAFEQERIPRGRPLTPIPALAVSAYTDAQSKRHAIEAGFQIHLSKPTDIPVLLAAVARLTVRQLH